MQCFERDVSVGLDGEKTLLLLCIVTSRFAVLVFNFFVYFGTYTITLGFVVGAGLALCPEPQVQ